MAGYDEVHTLSAVSWVRASHDVMVSFTPYVHEGQYAKSITFMPNNTSSGAVSTWLDGFIRLGPDKPENTPLQLWNSIITELERTEPKNQLISHRLPTLRNVMLVPGDPVRRPPHNGGNWSIVVGVEVYWKRYELIRADMKKLERKALYNLVDRIRRHFLNPWDKDNLFHTGLNLSGSRSIFFYGTRESTCFRRHCEAGELLFHNQGGELPTRCLLSLATLHTGIGRKLQSGKYAHFRIATHRRILGIEILSQVRRVPKS